VGKYRPVPRTLSDIIRKVTQSTPEQEPTELLSPEQLRAAGQVPMLDPSVLFQGVTILPSPPPEEIKPPDQLFGKQAFAKPGKPLKGLAEMLPARRQPTSPLPPQRAQQTDRLRELPANPSRDLPPEPRSEGPKEPPKEHLKEPKSDTGTR